MLKMSQTELQLGTNITTQYIKQLGNNGGITEIKDKAFSIYDATGNQYALIDGTNALIGSAANYFQATSTGSVIAGPLDLSGATVTGLPASTDTTYDLGSTQSTNDVDVTLTGSDATVDTIKMVAGTNITLTDNGSNQITIDAAAGGGGDTPPMSMMALPAMPYDIFSLGGVEKSWRTNVMTTGYALGNINATGALGNVGFTIWPMTAGETLNKVQFNISSALANSGVELNLAIYDLTFRNGGGPGQFSSGIVPNDKVKDLGSIAADVTGIKTIDISTSPYVMPNNADYGAIAIAFTLNDPLDSGSQPAVSSWANAIWNGNSVVPQGTTAYRNFGPYFSNLLDGTNNYALPSNLSDPTYKVESNTSQPIWMFIQTEI